MDQSRIRRKPIGGTSITGVPIPPPSGHEATHQANLESPQMARLPYNTSYSYHPIQTPVSPQLRRENTDGSPYNASHNLIEITEILTPAFAFPTGNFSRNPNGETSTITSMPSPYPDTPGSSRLYQPLPQSIEPGHIPNPETKRAKAKAWYQWGHKKLSDESAHLAKQFDGRAVKAYRFYGQKVYRPQQSSIDLEQALNRTTSNDRTLLEKGLLTKDDQGRVQYRNYLGQSTAKYADVAAYLSPTNFRPRRLAVQAADYIIENHKQRHGEWRRMNVTGTVPYILKIAEWVLRPIENIEEDERRWSAVLSHKKKWAVILFHYVARTIVVTPFLQTFIALPFTAGWDDNSVDDHYLSFSGYHWNWPKHAINPLDQRPVQDPVSLEVAGVHRSSTQRLLRPRQLIVRRGNDWVLDSNADKSISYIFISFADKQFSPRTSQPGRELLQWVRSAVVFTHKPKLLNRTNII